MVLLYRFLQGWLEPMVYHLYGKGATGKTTLAMHCAARIANRGYKVIWMDTVNGFSIKRFREITSHMTDGRSSILQNILIFKARNNIDLDTGKILLMKNYKNWNPKLLIVDTAFGIVNDHSKQASWKIATEFLATVRMMVSLQKIPAIIINTVGFKPSLHHERPTAEAILRMLSVEDVFLRRLVGSDGPKKDCFFLSCDDESKFTISSKGIKLATKITTLPSRFGGIISKMESFE